MLRRPLRGTRLHSHRAAFVYATLQYCPEPRDDAEKALQDKEDGLYVRGRVRYVLA